MPRGDKSKYSDKQQRKAEHIEESYKAKGVSESEAEARAWETGQPRLGEPWQTSGQHFGERDDPRGIDAAGAQARHPRSFDDAQGRTD